MKVIRWLDKYLEAVFIAAGLVVMVAVMTAVPLLRMVTMPSASTIATDSSLEE